MTLLSWLYDRMSATRYPSDRGAVGMLIIGVVIGVALVIFGIIKFLIPGE